MSGPQTAQAGATIAASPSNFLESPFQKARSARARDRACLCGPWTSEDQRGGPCARARGPANRETPSPVWPSWHQGRRPRSETVAVDMDPVSLLCRLATSVPPPRFHTIHYAGVIAAASPWRSRVTPPPTAENAREACLGHETEKRVRKSGYRPWAELLQRTFAVDVLTCPNCQGRMRLLAVVRNPVSIARYLAAAGELTEVPSRAPGRGPPYWKSRVLRRRALGDQSERAAWPRATARTTATKATKQHKKRRRKGWFAPRARSLGHREGLARPAPARCGAGRAHLPLGSPAGRHGRSAAMRIHW
jgi:hypothetical protein